MFSKLKQIKNLRDQAKKIQNTLGQETIEGSDTWNNVKVTMDGNMQVMKVEIKPEMLSSDNKSKLEDNVKDAVNNTIKKAQKLMAKKMQEMGGLEGLNLPGM